MWGIWFTFLLFPYDLVGGSWPFSWWRNANCRFWRHVRWLGGDTYIEIPGNLRPCTCLALQLLLKSFVKTWSVQELERGQWGPLLCPPYQDPLIGEGAALPGFYKNLHLPLSLFPVLSPWLQSRAHRTISRIPSSRQFSSSTNEKAFGFNPKFIPPPLNPIHFAKGFSLFHQ